MVVMTAAVTMAATPAATSIAFPIPWNEVKWMHHTFALRLPSFAALC